MDADAALNRMDAGMSLVSTDTSRRSHWSLARDLGAVLSFVLLTIVTPACGSSPSPSTPSTQPSIQSVTVTANVASLTSAGQTAQATATATLSSGITQDVTASCSNWQSDNTRALTVNSTGFLTAQGNGSATITTTCQSVVGRGSMTVALKPAAPSTFTLSGTITDGSSHGILPNIAVQIADGPNAGRATKTDGAGNYVLANLAPSVFSVTVSAIRYSTTTQAVTLAGDSRLDVVLPRNDAFPVDGTYNYTLVVHSPAWCLTHASVEAGGCSPPGPSADWVNSDLSLDGQLAVDGDGANLRFVLPPDPYDLWGRYSTFAFQRAGTHLNGIILASAPISTVTIHGTPVVSAFMRADVFSGETDNTGRFWGIFDGQMQFWRAGPACNFTFVCATSGFMWTLTPR